MFSKRILCQSWQQFQKANDFGIVKLASRGSAPLPVGGGFHPFRPIRNSSKVNQLNSSSNSQSQGLQPKPTPFSNVPTNTGAVPPSNVAKAFFFTCAFSGGCFIGATILEYENIRNKVMKHIEKNKLTHFLKTFKNNEQRKIQESALVKEISKYWNMLTPGEKVFAPLCALNLIVFGLWRIPRLQIFMTNYFCSNPASRIVCWPMFLSTFSHYSAFHIFANMYVLHSFSNAAVQSLGKEQFLGLYLSAGVISSFSSYLLKAVTSNAGLSLGASGAIMTILAYVCTQYPDTQLGILFIPTLTFSAGAAIKVIMGIDLVGCILGWKFFDHAAHLGGALFGVYWAYFGKDIWLLRESVLRFYHSNFRSDTRK